MNATRTTTVGNETKARLLQTASALSQTAGYDALSLQDLADRMGIRKASIFHYFASKDELACAVVEADIKVFTDWAETVQNYTPMERLHKYFEYHRQIILKGQVCPGGAFAVSWPQLNSKVKEALVQMHKQNISFLEDLVRLGIENGTFQPQTLSSDIIKAIPDMLQGAIQVGRAGNTLIPINRIERLTKVLLGVS